MCTVHLDSALLAAHTPPPLFNTPVRRVARTGLERAGQGARHASSVQVRSTPSAARRPWLRRRGKKRNRGPHGPRTSRARPAPAPEGAACRRRACDALLQILTGSGGRDCGSTAACRTFDRQGHGCGGPAIDGRRDSCGCGCGRAATECTFTHPLSAIVRVPRFHPAHPPPNAKAGAGLGKVASP